MTSVGFAALLFTVALLAWLISCLVINTRNISLTMEIQKMNEEIAALKSANQTLNYEIQSLENKDRVYEVAQAADLDQVSENIISLSGD